MTSSSNYPSATSPASCGSPPRNFRLVYGRLDAEHTHTARLEAEGISLDDIRAVFPGV